MKGIQRKLSDINFPYYQNAALLGEPNTARQRRVV